MQNPVGTPPTLIIVLSVVLGSIALLLSTLAFFLVGRCRRRRLSRRGVTPINDDEIESWRGTEKKLSLSVATRSMELNRTGTLIPLSPEADRPALPTPMSPDWGYTWSTADPIQSPPPTRSRQASLVATAPNARIGLTTDTVPGAEPFVPVNRESRRLSKGRNHARSKSMRSSASAKSMRSLNGDSVTAFDFTMNHETAMPWLPYENRNIEDLSTIGGSTPSTSIYAGTSDVGYSPRPKYTPYDSLNHITALSPRPGQRQWTSPQSPTSPTSPAEQQWPISWRGNLNDK